ncbi:MAG: hypothetical protein LBJ38_03580 [Oscillospiraceae bacterium]|nr:hypothetical protein [Oscillospiraceae bacterium]
MKEGYVVKDAGKHSDDLALINKYTRRPLKDAEVYIFNLVLCDNDLDRDFECFSREALIGLQKLFLGKTGIFDHEHKGTNQMARIFATEVACNQEKTTHSGEEYHMLTAKAYMVRSEKNQDLILEIDGGIKKEVSIGCNIASCLCSICGTDLKNGRCNHTKGKQYVKNGRSTLCYRILTNPIDAYEWSFVAVPAQKHAGVVKGIGQQNTAANTKPIDCNIQEFRTKLKSLGANGAHLSKSCLREIQLALEELDELKITMKDFKEELIRQVECSYALSQPQLSLTTIKSIVSKMSSSELQEFKKANAYTSNIQTKPQTTRNKTFNHKSFEV